MKNRCLITLALIVIALARFPGQLIAQPAQQEQLAQPEPLKISRIYPHLTVYGVYSENGVHTKPGHEECGIGAIMPWGEKLWMVNYAPHKPRGSEHKLFSVDAGLNLAVHPQSVGGTPAGRMIHEESQQLFIAHYAISLDGTVRVIPIEKMPIRVTAITRHLSDPADKVYYVDMEGSIWEADVHTLEVTQLFKKPVPGWHAKGGYVSQGRLVISNNGEPSAGSYKDLLVGGKAETEEDRGVLAQYDGKNWSIIERRQYTDVTGPAGIKGGSDSDDPIWAIGWDRRSVRLKLLDQGKWSTFLLPKAAFCNDAYHGWYTESPRICEITDGRWMMDMHGMFFDFPPSFSKVNTSGIRPIGSHLRYIPDFCQWNGQLVFLAVDKRGEPKLSDDWTLTDMSITWGGENYTDVVYQRSFTAGTVKIPENIAQHIAGSFGMPHLAFVQSDASSIKIASPTATVSFPTTVAAKSVASDLPVRFKAEIDKLGDGNWEEYSTFELPAEGYIYHVLLA